MNRFIDIVLSILRSRRMARPEPLPVLVRSFSRTRWLGRGSAVVLAALTLPSVVRAQSGDVPLLLDEAIEAARQHNKTLLLARLDEDIAAATYRQTDAVFLPQAGISFTGLTTDNPLNAFGLKLQQQSITQQDFDPALLNNPSRTNDYVAALQIQQPVLNLDQLYLRKSAKKQIDLNRFKTARTSEYITFQVQQVYLQLHLTYTSRKVLEEALATARTMSEVTANHFEQGLTQKSDLLNAQVQVRSIETNLADVNSRIETLSDQLNLLMGRPEDQVYRTPDSLVAGFQIEPDRALPPDRSDFRAMETAIESFNLAIKGTRMNYLPRLNAFGTYQLNDHNLFGFGSGAYLAGFQLSWDLFKGNETRNKLVTQTLERDRLARQLDVQKDESQAELNKAYRQLSDARYKIERQILAVEQASEALRILQDRYAQGLVNTTDVLMAQTQLSQQKLAHAEAVFTREVTAAYIQFLTVTTQKS